VSRIYTRRGDRGRTDLLLGGRVRKDSARVEAYGTVDELSSVLGVAASFSSAGMITESILKVQADLFLIGALLARDREASGEAALEAIQERIPALESQMDSMSRELPRLRNFIAPGGKKTAAVLHQARAVCRRAERRVVALSRKSRSDALVLKYLNRLSDFLFVLARLANRNEGGADLEVPGVPPGRSGRGC